MQTLTRGPLPARVYWTRRLLVAGTAFALVFAVAHLFGGNGRDSASGPKARQAAAHTKTATKTPTVTGPAPTAGPAVPAGARKDGARDDRDDTAGKGGKKGKHRPPPLPDPEGDCVGEDIAVTPTVRKAVAGGRVTFVMKLRTIDTPACTWRVSPETLTVKVTSGEDDIWFSRECTRSIPREDVVVRNTQNTEVDVVWSGRRSDEECSHQTYWAMPGFYHVSAAAYAGEPSDTQFELVKPDRPVVEQTVKADPKKRERGEERSDGNQQDGRKKQDQSQQRD